VLGGCSRAPPTVCSRDMNQVALFARSPDRQPDPEHTATIKAVAQPIESDNPTLQPRIRLCRFLVGLDRPSQAPARSKDTRCLSPSGADLNAWQLFASSSRDLSLRSRPDSGCDANVRFRTSLPASGPAESHPEQSIAVGQENCRIPLKRSSDGAAGTTARY
jgi:hypothetical protein